MKKETQTESIGNVWTLPKNVGNIFNPVKKKMISRAEFTDQDRLDVLKGYTDEQLGRFPKAAYSEDQKKVIAGRFVKAETKE